MYEETPVIKNVEYSIERLLSLSPDEHVRYYYNPVTQLPPQTVEDRGKLTIVLDMDETLLHTTFLTPFTTHLSFDFVVEYSPDHKRGVTLRPFLLQFIEQGSKCFEFIVFTAGLKEYADPILDHIDPSHTYIKHRLYREATTKLKNTHVKPVEYLNRDIKKVILVDNTIWNLLASPDNSILIPNFYTNRQDVQIHALANLLVHIANHSMEDVRVFLRERVQVRQKLANCKCQYIE